MIRVEVKTDATERSLRIYVKNLQDVALKGLSDAADAAQKSAKETIHATTTRRTGSAEDSWYRQWMSLTTIKLYSFAKHTRFINDGTHGHFIPGGMIPRAGPKMLRFVVNGKVMFRRTVYHPGTKPRPFEALALAAGQMGMRASLEAGASRLARDF